MISFSELVCAVSVMRSAQKQYFKTKDKKDLYHAWNMERAVDQMLENAFAPVSAVSPGSENENPPSASAEQTQEDLPPQQDCAF